jgi:hypothetical protein
VDALIAYSFSNNGYREISDHYNDCLGRSHMNNVQLADNLANYVAGKPGLQGGTVEGALLEYLVEMCGPPPPPPPN